MADNVPRHVAIIMDGNGRWAKRRLLPRSAGHRKGVSRIKEIVEAAKNAGVKALTIYALSTENLARPQEELNTLFQLFDEYFDKQFDELIQKGARLHTMGDLTALPQSVQDKIEAAKSRSSVNTEFVLNIALNYGAKQEILRAVNSAVSEGKHVDEVAFNSLLYTSDLPTLDLIIRTGGEKRLSNFLLYQAAYAELYFTDLMWPDFTAKKLLESLDDYEKRSRRFGKI